ncbi:MAG: hypothetical protein H6737_25430 [Alphaproteobacteria bacterium]|nr:hypothetical protein [Alphaproteobacteria bacterium]
MDWSDYLTFTANVSRGASEAHKIYIAGGALVLLMAWPTIIKASRQVATTLLVVLTLISTANYMRWGPRLATERVDSYDVIHYYLNAKYFDELGYLDLYPACMLADADNGGPFFKQQGNIYMAQDDKGHTLKPTSHALQRGRFVRDTRFTPERWKQFEHDFLYLQRERFPMGDELWRQMIQDHGFNGTPVWTLLARPFAQLVPVEYIKALGYIDVVLLFIGFGAIWWAYGGITCLWAFLFFTVSYSLRWPTVSWVFLRYDWICGLLCAMAMLKKQKHWLAGMFAGWAATLRLFPAFWMWGPFAKGLAGLARGKVHRQLLVLALGWIAVVAVLELGAMVRFGPGEVVTHLENMSDHNRAEQLSSRRIGLALALAYEGPWEERNPVDAQRCKFVPCKILEPWRKTLIHDQAPMRYGLGLLVMIVMGWGLRNASDDEAFGFGFIPIFLLTTMSYYYYIARVTLVVVHAADLSKLRNQIGLVLLLGLELFSNWSEDAWTGHRTFLIGYLAWGLAAYTAIMMAMMLWEARQGPSPEEA